MELLQQTINYRHPLYVEFFPDDVLTREFEKNLAEQAMPYMKPVLGHIKPVGTKGGGGIAGCCSSRARSTSVIPPLLRTLRTYLRTYLLILLLTLLLTLLLACLLTLLLACLQPSRVCSRPSRTSCMSSGRTPRRPSSRPFGRRQTQVPRRRRRTLTVHEPPLGDVWETSRGDESAHAQSTLWHASGLSAHFFPRLLETCVLAGLTVLKR